MKSKKHRAGKRPKYNMRGCSKKRRKYLGGQNPQNYTPVPSTGPLLPNTQTSLNSKFQSGGQRGGATTFIGSPWSATNWPSANNANHYSMNTYTPVDIQLQTKVLGANPPFSKGGRRMRNSKIGSRSRSRSRSRRALQKGGNLSNFLLQDLVNFGRTAVYGIGTTFNNFRGVSNDVYAAPPNPLFGQFPRGYGIGKNVDSGKQFMDIKAFPLKSIYSHATSTASRT